MLALLRFGPHLILAALCGIFYTVLYFYTQSALEDAQTKGAVQYILQLRATFSFFFSLLLGFVGVKLSGHILPAMLVHTVIVATMLLIDVSWQQLVAEWELSLLILATIAGITGVASAVTLCIFWLMHRYQFSFRRKKRP